jgi:hypothetical protein
MPVFCVERRLTARFDKYLITMQHPARMDRARQDVDGVAATVLETKPRKTSISDETGNVSEIERTLEKNDPAGSPSSEAILNPPEHATT